MDYMTSNVHMYFTNNNIETYYRRKKGKRKKEGRKEEQKKKGREGRKKTDTWQSTKNDSFPQTLHLFPHLFIYSINKY